MLGQSVAYGDFVWAGLDTLSSSPILSAYSSLNQQKRDHDERVALDQSIELAVFSRLSYLAFASGTDPTNVQVSFVVYNN